MPRRRFSLENFRTRMKGCIWDIYRSIRTKLVKSPFEVREDSYLVETFTKKSLIVAPFWKPSTGDGSNPYIEIVICLSET